MTLIDGPTVTDLPHAAVPDLRRFHVAADDRQSLEAAALGRAQRLRRLRHAASSASPARRWPSTTGCPSRLQLIGGVLYLNRDNVRILPAGGLIWTPADWTRFELLFPKPKLAVRIGVGPGFEDWVFTTAEFGGNTWPIVRDSGLHGQRDLHRLPPARRLRAEAQRRRGLPPGRRLRLRPQHHVHQRQRRLRPAEHDSDPRGRSRSEASPVAELARVWTLRRQPEFWRIQLRQETSRAAGAKRAGGPGIEFHAITIHASGVANARRPGCPAGRTRRLDTHSPAPWLASAAVCGSRSGGCPRCRPLRSARAAAPPRR